MALSEIQEQAVRAFDDLILTIMQSEVIPGNEGRSYQSLAVVAFKLAEHLGMHKFSSHEDLKAFTGTVHGRLICLCKTGRVKAKMLSPGVESVCGFQYVNILDALAESGS